MKWNNIGINIRIVALIFLPLSLTMLIPLFLLKENNDDIEQETTPTKKHPTFIKSLSFTFTDMPFIFWLGIVFVMNAGLQLFLSGINEYFSTMQLDMAVIMACCFAPVPLTILLYNKIVSKFGLGVAFRYILIVFSIGMALMGICDMIPEAYIYPFAILCSIIVSFSIGAFFSVTYTVPSNRAAARKSEDSETASSMYFAVQGLCEGASAGLASGVILVFLKEKGFVPYLTVIAAVFCMTAFALSFLLPKAVTQIGKISKK